MQDQLKKPGPLDTMYEVRREGKGVGFHDTVDRGERETTIISRSSNTETAINILIPDRCAAREAGEAYYVGGRLIISMLDSK